ncbi:MAG TPA: hypothetical protein VM431_03800 [Phycisphaerae bacterium]|nr:hypothetical protein [Phycisphaerae bacterium]
MVNLHSNRSRAAQGDLPREVMYRDWLGIKNPAPSYYGLLGLPELESDETAVLHAGRHVKRKLRAYQIGLYRKQALELLAEVGQAVSVLTNAEKKRAYDGKLMAQWRAAVEELYQTHCDGAAKEAAVLEAFLTACQLRGVPVTRLMPYFMQRLTKRAGGWPPQGEHGVPLPISLWIYRDLVVLGQCLRVGALEKRIEAVKQIQKLLAIPEGLARLVAEEVSQAQHVFSRARIVTQAKTDAEAVLLRLGRRIRRWGGDVGKGKVLAAVARLLGKHKADLDRALARMDEAPVDLSAGQTASLAARRARRRLQKVGRGAGSVPAWVGDWIAARPQLLVALAVATGVLALVVAFLVLAGIVQPWQPDTPAPDAGDPQRVGIQAATVRPQPPVGPPSPRVPTIEESPPDWLAEFRKKYPAGKGPPPPVEPRSPSNVKFFGVRGDKREPGAPVEVPNGPSSPPGPAPKAPAPKG